MLRRFLQFQLRGGSKRRKIKVAMGVEQRPFKRRWNRLVHWPDLFDKEHNCAFAPALTPCFGTKHRISQSNVLTIATSCVPYFEPWRLLLFALKHQLGGC
ncbi:Uncharacterised protein [Vibrio cholerae]|nr:Uncharacterised protein [Vibrio cholerae]